MRRFSTTTAAASDVAGATARRWSLSALLQQQPIEELPELKTLSAVQRLAEQLSQTPAPARLLTGDSDSHTPGLTSWLQRYQAEKQWNAAAQVDKQAFEALVADCVAHIKAVEDVAWKAAGAVDAESTTDAHVEALQVQLARAKCAGAATSFELLDKDKDGHVSLEQAQKLLETLAGGNTDEWLQKQFELFDADSDSVVPNLPKKHDKLLLKSMSETNWTAKVPEKVRCVFHFADKEDDEGTKLAWESFKASQVQEAELEELDRIVAVYAKGHYDERTTFHERKRESRTTRLRGLVTAVALAFSDYIASFM
ncbi:hypothetical protein PybrP1_011324 [[Pythium] brassicae (nom. inval.)]|nr:hypothetical protein PybrP1_011324 [[Pythium] brassicae (nom. inval.)]